MFSAVPLPAQPVDATQALNLSAGVSNCKVSRGRSLRHYSIVRGAKAGHLPETLRIIEQMRLMLVGKGKLKRDQ